MLFRRRKPLKLSERMGHFMWPRRGWSRALRYYTKRLLRLSGSPHSVAIGFATGVAMSMTPFIGFHYLLCIATAFLLRGNIVAGVLGTSVGNPLTYPLIWVGTFEIGNLILGLFGQGHGDLRFEDIAHHLVTESWHTIWPIIEPMLIGAVPLALVSGAIAYAAIYSHWSACNRPGASASRRAGVIFVAGLEAAMIIGLGSDLIDIRRVEKTLERFGTRFTMRVFTEIERQKSDRRAERAASYAKRFAAKEACSKALGTGLSQGVFWSDMGVVNLPSGKPTMQLTGGAADRLAALLPREHRAAIHLTITDDYPLAQAFVIIEALPIGTVKSG